MGHHELARWQLQTSSDRNLSSREEPSLPNAVNIGVSSRADQTHYPECYVVEACGCVER